MPVYVEGLVDGFGADRHAPIVGLVHPGGRSELRPETWTRLMVVVMRLAVGPDPGILLGSGP